MKLLPLTLIVLLLAACSAKAPTEDKGAAYHIQEAERRTERKDYEEAIAAWEKVRDGFYSPELNILAEVKIADTHYLAEQYIEAAAAYEDFLQQHPGERNPRVLFQLGMSYHQQKLGIDRDQTATHKAIAVFQDFISRYPDDPRAATAAEYIRTSRAHIAEHEFSVGRFYLRTGAPEAAINRFTGLLSLYPEYGSRDKVYLHLGQAYLKSGKPEQAAEIFQTLEREFPDSEHLDKARKALKKGS
jgi:outer membrane protein assembly factor BamD